MPKIKRQTPPLHILVPDTNILWCEDKSLVVSTEFESFWNGFAEEFEIKLLLPEVVRGELLYQQTSSALQALERANKQFQTLSNIADVNYTHRVLPSKVSRDVESRFSRWETQVRAEISETPIDEIDWRTIINDALWRNPPFSEEKGQEKGFRDRLILETLCIICSKEPNADIAFISKDRVLREAATERLSTNEKCSVYESLEEFSSYLRLTKEELTEVFVRAIQRRARDKFLDSKHETGLLYDAKVIDQIRVDFQDKFKPPIEIIGLTSLIASGGESSHWVHHSDEGVWIGSTRFDHLEKESEFHWVSRVSFVQLFVKRYMQPTTELPQPVFDLEKLRTLQFNVSWKARVKTDGRFYNLEIVEISFEDEQFEIPTPQQIENYKIRRYVQNEKETSN